MCRDCILCKQQSKSSIKDIDTLMKAGKATWEFIKPEIEELTILTQKKFSIFNVIGRSRNSVQITLHLLRIVKKTIGTGADKTLADDPDSIPDYQYVDLMIELLSKLDKYHGKVSSIFSFSWASSNKT